MTSIQSPLSLENSLCGPCSDGISQPNPQVDNGGPPAVLGVQLLGTGYALELLKGVDEKHLDSPICLSRLTKI